MLSFRTSDRNKLGLMRSDHKAGKGKQCNSLSQNGSASHKRKACAILRVRFPAPVWVVCAGSVWEKNVGCFFVATRFQIVQWFPLQKCFSHKNVKSKHISEAFLQEKGKIEPVVIVIKDADSPLAHRP